jgi:hypothetical protein
LPWYFLVIIKTFLDQSRFKLLGKGEPPSNIFDAAAKFSEVQENFENFLYFSDGSIPAVSVCVRIQSNEDAAAQLMIAKIAKMKKTSFSNFAPPKLALCFKFTKFKESSKPCALLFSSSLGKTERLSQFLNRNCDLVITVRTIQEGNLNSETLKFVMNGHPSHYLNIYYVDQKPLSEATECFLVGEDEIITKF